MRLGQLVSRHRAFVANVQRRSGVPEADVDDAVQQTFIVVANHLDDIFPKAEKGFIFRVAKRVASRARRSVARRATDSLGDRDFPHDQSPERALAQKRIRTLLDEATSRLPADLRAVFVLHEIDGLTGPEIARSLALPLGTVASRLRRARVQFSVEVKRTNALRLASFLPC